MEHSKHIVRAVLILVVIAVVGVFVRHFATPKSFGAHGHYRFDSVAEYAEQPPMHGPPGICAECHEDEGDTLSGGKHAAVSCEVCHAPLHAPLEAGKAHVDADGQWQATMRKNRSYELCAWCHQRLAARPEGFPQVMLVDHVTKQDIEFTEEVCLECHDAHDPGS